MCTRVMECDRPKADLEIRAGGGQRRAPRGAPLEGGLGAPRRGLTKHTRRRARRHRSLGLVIYQWPVGEIHSSTPDQIWMSSHSGRCFNL